MNPNHNSQPSADDPAGLDPATEAALIQDIVHPEPKAQPPSEDVATTHNQARIAFAARAKDYKRGSHLPGQGHLPRAIRLTPRQDAVLRIVQERILTWGYPPTIREIGEVLKIRSTNGVADHLRALQRKGYLEMKGKKSRAMALSPLAVSHLQGVRPDSSHEKILSNISTKKNPTDAELAPASATADGANPTQAGHTQMDALAGRTTQRSAPAQMLHLQRHRCVPLLGRVAAGEPILAEENAEESLFVDSRMVGEGRDVFALRVIGESMIDDGIQDGDTLFVSRSLWAESGAIVVAIIEGEATVKRFYPEGEQVRLQPSNAAMQPIFVNAREFREIALAGVVVGSYRRFR